MRKLPKIDVLADVPEIAAIAPVLGRTAVMDACRRAVQHAKDAAEKEGVVPNFDHIVHRVVSELRRRATARLGPVVNATGVLLHTNLGRAPLGEDLFREMMSLVSGYCNLEIDVSERRRGIRAPGVSELLCSLCCAEAATVVNNNAAALFLILSALAKGREVIVSRGELVQIGGGFRIPDILRDAGAKLVEVGTTNITTARDYADAVTEDTALILSVHRANFTMSGFVRSPSLSEIRAATDPSIPVVSDMGSGNFLRSAGGTALHEPTPEDALRQGADLVCFSCDKMLGSTQAGVAAGKGTLVETLERHPVMRVVRPGKLTFAALQAVLTHYAAGRPERIPLWQAAAATAESLADRVRRFIAKYGLDSSTFEPRACEAAFGGGSVPDLRIPSFGLAIVGCDPERAATYFQRADPPVVGRILEDGFLLDFRTVRADEEAPLGEICRRFDPCLPPN